ncbi:ArsR/SmtB family transcription factor [Demequina gelatinilytica]|uniref:ArsR/SmtB family transcription factor n=1 Tax=Demequina gelatinilytica TaxID=1638980 RepID=UPI0007846558|nr:helix-turn-helix domain-containing protein [Demequina gelatinilytica]
MVYQSIQREPLDERLDRVFAALAHPARREVLRVAATSPAPITMSELADGTGMSPQLLNKHAAALEQAGLVSRVARGRERRVTVDASAMDEALDWMNRARAFWGGALDSLGAYAEALDKEQP